MIELELTKDEAMLVANALKAIAARVENEIIEKITEAEYIEEDKSLFDDMDQIAAYNVRVNLQTEVDRLTKLLAEKEAAPAPYGYKKDGTPKKLPGRPAKKGIK